MCLRLAGQPMAWSKNGNWPIVPDAPGELDAILTKGGIRLSWNYYGNSSGLEIQRWLEWGMGKTDRKSSGIHKFLR
jgi:hypothetical protein